MAFYKLRNKLTDKYWQGGRSLADHHFNSNGVCWKSVGYLLSSVKNSLYKYSNVAFFSSYIEIVCFDNLKITILPYRKTYIEYELKKLSKEKKYKFLKGMY